MLKRRCVRWKWLAVCVAVGLNVAPACAGGGRGMTPEQAERRRAAEQKRLAAKAAAAKALEEAVSVADKMAADGQAEEAEAVLRGAMKSCLMDYGSAEQSIVWRREGKARESEQVVAQLAKYQRSRRDELRHAYHVLAKVLRAKGDEKASLEVLQFLLSFDQGPRDGAAGAPASDRDAADAVEDAKRFAELKHPIAARNRAQAQTWGRARRLLPLVALVGGAGAAVVLVGRRRRRPLPAPTAQPSQPDEPRSTRYRRG